jgi:hypothetical protein
MATEALMPGKPGHTASRQQLPQVQELFICSWYANKGLIGRRGAACHRGLLRYTYRRLVMCTRAAKVFRGELPRSPMHVGLVAHKD